MKFIVDKEINLNADESGVARDLLHTKQHADIWLLCIKDATCKRQDRNPERHKRFNPNFIVIPVVYPTAGGSTDRKCKGTTYKQSDRRKIILKSIKIE